MACAVYDDGEATACGIGEAEYEPVFVEGSWRWEMDG